MHINTDLSGFTTIQLVKMLRSLDLRRSRQAAYIADQIETRLAFLAAKAMQEVTV